MAIKRALFERFPALEEALPWIELGEFPTPVSPAESLATELGLDALWIKNDECCAPAYGGNKIRKLEFLLADARQRGCHSVLTYGGAGSNHALATAINCHELGLSCMAILTPEPATEAVRRTLLYHLALGTRLIYAHDYGDVRAAADNIRTELGEACYEIPFGGSSWVGACGFVSAALELAHQIDAGKVPQPDVIYLALGTAGSAAGLALGLAIAAIETRIEAVQVTPASMGQDALYARLFASTNRELNQRDVHVPLFTEPFAQTVIRTDQLGKGYAYPTPAGREALEFMHVHLDLPASLTYTAKAMAGLIKDARNNKLGAQQIMFWNTYNAQPYPELPAGDAWQKLPDELHYFFASGPE